MKTWVTGGSSGVGFAVAERVVARGENVLCLSRRAEAPRGARGRHLDQAAPNLEQAVEALLEEEGPPGRLVLAGGMGAFVGVHETTRERFRRLVAVNLEGAVIVAAHAVRDLRRRRLPGRIVFVTSTCAAVGGRGLGLYAATKAGVEAWVRCEAPGQARKGVDLLAVALGWIESPMTAHLRPEIRAAAERRSPEGRFATSGEAAAFVLKVLIDPRAYPAGGVYPFWEPWRARGEAA